MGLKGREQEDFSSMRRLDGTWMISEGQYKGYQSLLRIELKETSYMRLHGNAF